MASLLDKLTSERTATGLEARSKEAREWFIERVRELNGKIRRTSLLQDTELKMKPNPIAGHMYMFVYDALHKETLPYYDRFPLVILLGPAPGGFMGLNMHYLDPRARAVFLDRLVATLSDDKLTERTRLRVRYKLLNSAARFRYFRPCLKHYLTDQIQSRISQVSANHWETAIFLPTEHFKGARKERVWRDSQKIYRGQSV
jgi:hypothetical protein